MRFAPCRVPHPLRAPLLTLALLASGIGIASAAEFTAGASASAQGASLSQQRGGPDPKTGGAPVWAGADVNLYDYTAPGVLQNAGATGYASASYGHLVFVSRAATNQTSVSGDQPGLHAESYASASAIDSFTVTCPTCVAGTRGTMSFRVVLEGDVGLLNGSYRNGQPVPGPARTTLYSWSSNLSMRADGVAMDFPGPGTLSLFAYDFRAMVNDDIVSGGSREGMGIYDYQLEFEFGSAIHMNWQAVASSLADLRADDGLAIGELSAMGYAAFSNSFYWDGISAVTDANGNLVNGFTALNSVGVDYARSMADAAVVPEPGTWALMVAGLVLLGAIARRRPRPRRTRGPFSAAAAVGAVGAVFGGALMLGDAALAQQPTPPAFDVSYLYELGAPGAGGRSNQGGGATSAGEVRRFTDAIGFSGAALSSDARIEGWGAARYGHLQAFAKGSTALAIQGMEQGTYVSGGITTSLTDSFVIQCGSCAAGTLGWMTFHVGMDAVTSRDGGLGPSNDGSGLFMADTHWTTSLSLAAAGVPDPPPLPPDGWGGPNPGQLWQSTYRLDKLHNGEHTIEEMTHGSSPSPELSIQFVFGEPIRLDMSLSASVLGAVFSGQNSAPFSGYGAMETDATRSLYWGGIDSVFDAQGNRVSVFTALNGAGADYARSFANAALVPEPGTWALMGAGLVLLVLRSLQARRRPGAGEGRLGSRRRWRTVWPTALLLAGAVSVGAQTPPEFRTSQSLTTSLAGESLTQTREGSLRDVRVDGALTQMSQSADLAGSVQLSTWGRAGYGYVQAFAQGASLLSTTQPDRAAEALGSSSASSSDSFVINCDGCVAGTRGRFHARVYLDGTTHLAGGVDNPAALHAGYVDRSAGVSVHAEGVPWDTPPPGWPPEEPFPPNNPGQVATGGQRMDILYNDYTETFGDASFGPGYRYLTVHFIFGQPIHVQLYSSASVMAVVAERGEPAVSGWAMSTTDFSRSTFWDGVLGVVDEYENPLREFTALNAAGIDYRRSFANAAAAAVPEAGSWTLMAAGLLALGGIARRRRPEARS